MKRFFKWLAYSGETKRMVCLANSRKMGERCVAGIELVDGKPVAWIRPVSKRPHEELAPRERQYANGNEPRLLDIIEVPVQEHRPKQYQSENWLIASNRKWKERGTFSWNELLRLVNHKKPLWINGHHTHNGYNDHVPLAEARTLDHSLRLVHVDRWKLHVFKVYYKPTVQAEFSFGGTSYRLKVTDPLIEETYIHTDGEYDLGESLLTISLGEPFNDCCYKLVAAVLRKP
ncbi:MAG TPA: hypothetical protein VFH95_11175 [Candidatus Kapabacteria bacterium]|nr:hypothetical protein [Candidatus Kapabacteria bacterium]